MALPQPCLTWPLRPNVGCWVFSAHAARDLRRRAPPRSRAAALARRPRRGGWGKTLRYRRARVNARANLPRGPPARAARAAGPAQPRTRARALPIYRPRTGVAAGRKPSPRARARRTAAPARGGLGPAGTASLDRALAPGQSTTPLARPPLLDRSASTGAWAGAGAQRPSRKLRCHSPASPGR